MYLDSSDRELLDQVAVAAGIPRTEVLRRGLRSFAAETLGGGREQGGLGYLVGVLHGASVPADLAEHHDQYLAESDEKDARRSGVD